MRSAMPNPARSSRRDSRNYRPDENRKGPAARRSPCRQTEPPRLQPSWRVLRGEHDSQSWPAAPSRNSAVPRPQTTNPHKDLPEKSAPAVYASYKPSFVQPFELRNSALDERRFSEWIVTERSS